MASKVNPTPTLSGTDADRFIRKLNTPSTDEEIKALKRAKKLLQKLNSKDKFINIFDINLDTSAYYFYFLWL